MPAPDQACEIADLARGSHDGAVVVIDVIRAFTTAAAALAAGAVRVICVETLAEAHALRQAEPSAVLMGEQRGLRPDGFDFGNSPSQFDRADVRGAVIVQRTSNGTRGLAWTDAPLVLAAGAVTRRLRRSWPAPWGRSAWSAPAPPLRTGRAPNTSPA